MSFDLYVWAGGYWSRDGEYLGGESHSIGKYVADSVRKVHLMALITTVLGYEDNMCRVSWFPPDANGAPVEIVEEHGFRRAAHYGTAAGALTLYVVRNDDPFVETRLVPFRPISDEEDARTETERDVGEGNGLEVDEEDADGIDFYNSDSSYGGRTHVSDSKDKEFEVGQVYCTIDSFKRALNNYAVKRKRNIKYRKSDSTRVFAICDDEDCGLKIYASINSSSDSVVVRYVGAKHTCTWCGKVTLLTSTRIAEMYIEEFRVNPDLSGKQLQEKLMRKNIDLSWTKCERARLKCLSVLDREQQEQFARLHDYVYELKRSNPGSTVECEVRQSVFHRFYICLGGFKDGWKAACRRILHVDGTFLKWRMSGMLLVACGRDPNDQMFPVAWGVVDVESKENWRWFFQQLADDLELGAGNGLTVASAHQKGLIGAVRELMPHAEHRMCARHVQACWKRRHSGPELQDLFWSAADAYYPLAFDRKMQELAEYDAAARADLKISVFYPWSRYVKILRNDSVVEGMCKPVILLKY